MTPAARRRGLALVELVVVLTIGGAIALAIGGVLRRQQRFFTNASSVTEQRVHLRDATGILPGELRALAPGDGDVLAFSDSSLDLRATIGAAVACDTLAGGVGLDLAPVRLGNGAVLSAYATAPQAGDLALVYHPAATDAPPDDVWVAAEVAAASPELSACASSPLISPEADAAAPRLRLRFALGVRLPDTVRPGAFVRLLRRVRYRFYRAGTGDWYLGYAEWNGTAFGVVQPVSGPFASYVRGGRGGLALRFYDDAGAELSWAGDAGRIARVEIVARGLPGAGLSGVSIASGDSESVGVRLRNR